MSLYNGICYIDKVNPNRCVCRLMGHVLTSRMFSNKLVVDENEWLINKRINNKIQG